jgi:hypothetical protein
MSERDVLELVHRAAADAPPMRLSAASVLEGGRRRVRRRRATYAGMTLAAAASVVAVSFGVVGDGFLATRGVPPAGEDSQPVVSGDWDAELTFEDGTTYTLHPDGAGVLLETETRSYPLSASDMAAPMFTRVAEDGRTLVIVPGWDLEDPADARLGVRTGAELTWVTPQDTALIQLSDGRPLVAIAVAPDYWDLDYVPAEALADGSLELAVPGPGGTTLRVDGQSVTPSVGGEPLRRIAGQAIAGAVAYDAGEKGVFFVVEAPLDSQLVAIVLEEHGPRVHEDVTVETTPVIASTLVGLVPPASNLSGFALRSPQAVEDEAVNQWSVAGSADNGHVALDDGVVAVSGDTDLWLLTPTDAHVPLAGIVGQDVIAVRTSDTTVLLVTVLADGGGGQVVLGGGSTAPEVGTLQDEELAGRTISFGKVSLPDGAPVRDYIEGVDTDGDGTVDLPLTQVVDLTGAPLPDDG